jgi:hypothetical protein
MNSVTTAPSILFIPASGGDGAGEYFRCLAIAQGICGRWPRACIRFIVNREAGYAHDVPFDSVLVDGTPTFNTAEVNRAIGAMHADVAVFDSAGRVAQFAHARSSGTATVYISSRPTARRKGFRLRRMHHLDQHWLTWPRFLQGELTYWERLKLGLMGRPRIVFLDPVLPLRSAARANDHRRGLGIEGQPYLLVCAGAGGHRRLGVPAPEILVAAAATVGRTTGHPIVWVKGPNYRGDWHGGAGLLELDEVAPSELLDLIEHAFLAVVNGGSLLLQTLAVKTVCVAVPIADDQAARVDGCVRHGLAAGAPLDVETIAATIRALVQEPGRMADIRSRLHELDLGNGADQAVEALELLLSHGRKVR